VHIGSPNPKMPRDYAKEYMTYHGKIEQIKRHDAQNKARALMKKKGLVRKGDGLHVDHKNNNPVDNRPSNLRAVVAKTNLQKKEKINPRIGWELTRERWHLISVQYNIVVSNG